MASSRKCKRIDSSSKLPNDASIPTKRVKMTRTARILEEEDRDEALLLKAGEEYRRANVQGFEVHTLPPSYRQQANVLIDWSMFLGSIAQPCTCTEIKVKVFSMVGRIPCDDWVRKFLRRQPKIVARSGRGLDPKCTRAFNQPTVYGYFDKLEETGIQLGGGRKNLISQYIFAKSDKNHYVTKSESLQLVTILEAVSADGVMVPPGFVLPKGDMPDWRHVSGVGSVVVTESGLTDDEVCVQWFMKVFIPWAQARNKSGKLLLLISDGHGSHESNEPLEKAFTCGILLLSLPPHTTHKLQPLDVGVFGPLQKAWGKHCQLQAAKRDPVTWDNVIAAYMKICEEHISVKIIEAAFCHSGNWPINRHVFKDIDFAPSCAYSIKAQLPTSYPEYRAPSPCEAQETASEDKDDDGSGSGSDSKSETSLDSDVDLCPNPMTSAPTRLTQSSKLNLESSLRRSVAMLGGPIIIHGHSTVGSSQSPEYKGVSLKLNQERHLWQEERTGYIQEIARLRGQPTESETLCHFDKAQIQGAESHCTLAKLMNQSLREQLDNTLKPKARKGLHTGSRLLTAPELFEEFEAHRQEEEAKAKKEAAAKEAKESRIRARELE
ncbi:hypothetical protein M422DRAFT_239248 [Sphaerobolus stellatus SS14]|nr:hypothetical protein M422DRAFT_239248 [Sphaerobolus stellatus SS14]